ncbi:MAG: prepilin-type N-terminal cleavage/methylation domain-containing protein [Patescibacteria group bacterium]
MKYTHKKQGFTLIEVLVVIGIIAVLATVVLVAVNPGRQFAQARNTQRISNVNAVLNAVGQNIADNKGTFTCAEGALPATATIISSSAYDIRDCIIPNYMTDIPVDPSNGSITSTEYTTGYTILQDATTKRITLTAPSAELGEIISVTR